MTPEQRRSMERHLAALTYEPAAATPHSLNTVQALALALLATQDGLRDRLAAVAMQALLTRSDGWNLEQLARKAYGVADEMIRAREK